VVNALIIPGVPPPGITRMIEVHDRFFRLGNYLYNTGTRPNGVT
jgi:hypothetical protein